MIVRMCGRCQEEIDKERKRADALQAELEYIKAKMASALGLEKETIEVTEQEQKCFYIGDLTICPYCNNTKSHGNFLITSNQ